MNESTAINALDLSVGSVELTRRLCNIPSVSGGEKAIADAIEAELVKLPHLRLVRDGDTIVARTELGRGRRVIIAGHLDTVPVNENLPVHDAPDPETGDAHIWGRGTVDMQAGVAVQLVLAAELAEPAVDITWVWYDHEEVESALNGLGRTQRNHPELFEGDFAILGEPTRAGIEGGCNGTLKMRVILHGKRAHAARAWRGVNAIHRAGTILERLARFEPETVTVDGLDYRESLSAVDIRGGVAGNVIPDRCEILVNYRHAPSKSSDDAIAILRELFSDADELVVEDRAEGARPGLTDPIARGLIEATGLEPVAKLGWTDVSRFSALGIPAVNYGPGDALLAHADDERVRISEITAVENGLRAWIESLGEA